MLWSGSKPLTVVRENMWGFLMFAGVAWLAISWCVMRLEPSDITWPMVSPGVWMLDKGGTHPRPAR